MASRGKRLIELSKNNGKKFLTRSRESLSSAKKTLGHLSTPKVSTSKVVQKKLFFGDDDQVSLRYSKAEDKEEMVRQRSKEDIFANSDSESTVPMDRTREERVSLPPGPPPPPGPTTKSSPTPNTAPVASSSSAPLSPSTNISSFDIGPESVSLLSNSKSQCTKSPILLFSTFRPAAEDQEKDVENVEEVQDTVDILEDTSNRNHENMLDSLRREWSSNENLSTVPEKLLSCPLLETNEVPLVSDADQQQESRGATKTDDHLEIQKIFGSDSNTGDPEDSETNATSNLCSNQKDTGSPERIETSKPNEQVEKKKKGTYVNPKTSREVKRVNLNNKDDKRTYRQLKKSFDGKVLTIHDKIDSLHPSLGKEQDFLILLK